MRTASRLLRTTALTTALAVGAAPLPVRSFVSLFAAQQPPAPASSQPDPIALLDQIDRAVEATATPNWDLVRRAEALKGGLEPAFQLVRDEVAYEPYAGALRGAWGTYDSRAGNAVDRALLLAALLNQNKVTTRFAFGRLSLPDRERLLLRAFEQPAEVPALSAETSRGFLGSVFQRASRDYGRVRAAIGSRLPPVTNPTRAEILEEMNPHVWVQANSQGKWIDLDPSFPDSRVGYARVAADRTADVLPAELHQQVTIRVVAEHLSSGALARSTLLEMTRNAIELNHAQIALVHRQAEVMGGLGGAMASAFGRRNDQWTPTLWIAGDFTSGRSVEPSAASFVAEWIEFELQWPGGRREVTRRPLLDRGDAAWRERLPLDAAALSPVARDAGGPLDMQAVHNIWFSAGLHNLGDYLRALEELVLEAASGQASPTGTSRDFGRSLWPFALRNLTSVILTDHLAVPMLNDTPGVRVYADSPRISIFSSAPRETAGIRVTTDLRRDHLRGLAQPGSELVLAEKKLQFGLFQGALEHEFMRAFAVATGESEDGLSSTSSRLSDAALTTVMPSASGNASGVSGTRSPSALVRRALRQGSIVVAPAAGLDERAAWLEVDARTGDAHAVGGPGLHWTDFLGKGGKQANPVGTKSYDLRPRAEKVAERNAEFYKKIDARNAADRAAGRGNPSGPQANRGGGGLEYAVVLTISVLAGMAVWALSAYLEAKLYEECVQLAKWLADGGFRRAVQGGRRLVGR